MIKQQFHRELQTQLAAPPTANISALMNEVSQLTLDIMVLGKL